VDAVNSLDDLQSDYDWLKYNESLTPSDTPFEKFVFISATPRLWL
jgi:hypothetical protein